MQVPRSRNPFFTIAIRQRFLKSHKNQTEQMRHILWYPKIKGHSVIDIATMNSSSKLCPRFPSSPKLLLQGVQNETNRESREKSFFGLHYWYPHNHPTVIHLWKVICHGKKPNLKVRLNGGHFHPILPFRHCKLPRKSHDCIMTLSLAIPWSHCPSLSRHITHFIFSPFPATSPLHLSLYLILSPPLCLLIWSRFFPVL